MAEQKGGGISCGPKNGQWKGGRTITEDGYVLVRVGKSHHLADVRGYAYEHRIVAEQMLGRRLLPGEEVHHKKEPKSNNDPTNLEVLPGKAYHRMIERTTGVDRRRPGEENPSITCDCGCGETFLKYDDCGRPRRFVTGHNMLKGGR